MNRRRFLKLGIGAIGSGLLIYVAYDKRYLILEKAMTYIDNKDFDANAFIFVQPDGKVKVICHRSEMGQGVRTSVPMMMMEELDIGWEQVEVVQGLADAKYGSQNTDGSKSIRDFYFPLRKAAAAAREMLVLAAAQTWGVPVSECSTSAGHVIHKISDKSLGYGELVAKARELPVPKEPKLKDFKDFNIIGKPNKGIDAKAIAMGQAHFGIDTQIPDLHIAALKRAPVPGAKVKSFNATEVKKIPGVIDVIELEEQGPDVNANASVAVVAMDTYTAFKGRDLLEVEWDYKGLKLENSTTYQEELAKSLTKKLTVYRSEGKIENGKAQANKMIKSAYHTPYLVHAPMEPMVATADVKKNSCEVWAPCQDPMRSVKAISALLKLDVKDIKFNITFLGGGFGRKSQPDFVLEAVLLSKKLGKPVKVQWSREDEVRHGFYHAESYQELEAAVDASGYPLSLHHKSAFPTIMTVFMAGAETPAPWESGLGATTLPYRIPNILCEVGQNTTSLRIGWLRSVCNVWHAFAIQSFVDELAHNAKADPIAYQLKLLGKPRTLNPKDEIPQDTGRLSKVIEETRDRFEWNKPLPKGHGKGFASHWSFFSYVATAVEVSVQDNVIKVERVVTTIDCGLAVNPETVKAQMEGAVIFGLSLALHGKITVKDGIVEQSNFHDYPVARMSEAPPIEVVIINGNTDKPAGVGEPGVPPVAPAIANAIFAATGQRLKNLPLSLS